MEDAGGAAVTMVGTGEEDEEEEERKGLLAFSFSSLFSFLLSDKVFEVQSAVVFAFLPASLCNTMMFPCTFGGGAGVGVLLLGLLNLPRGPACTLSFFGPLFLVCDFSMYVLWLVVGLCSRQCGRVTVTPPFLRRPLSDTFPLSPET